MSRYRKDRPTRAETELAGAQRLKAVLASGRWPSGLPVAPYEREVIQDNIERAERMYAK